MINHMELFRHLHKMLKNEFYKIHHYDTMGFKSLLKQGFWWMVFCVLIYLTYQSINYLWFQINANIQPFRLIFW